MLSDLPARILAPMLLYVEDELLIQQMVVEALEEAGFAAIVASDGTQALERLKEHASDLRSLITDIDLGRGANGWDVAQTAREQASDLPVAYVSGASGHEWSSKGVPNSQMIAKPFAPAQIVVAISSLLVAADTAP